MACYKPLRAWRAIGGNEKTVNGKAVIYWQYNKLQEHAVASEELEIPCGRCIGCKLDYSRQWANRCSLEATQWQNNYFITLTYANEYLPAMTSPQ